VELEVTTRVTGSMMMQASERATDELGGGEPEERRRNLDGAPRWLWVAHSRGSWCPMLDTSRRNRGGGWRGRRRLRWKKGARRPWGRRTRRLGGSRGGGAWLRGNDALVGGGGERTVEGRRREHDWRMVSCGACVAGCVRFYPGDKVEDREEAWGPRT
jgi:hypothetical protein